MMRRDDGFTLIELLVVVLILGILVSVALPLFVRQKHNAELRSCFHNQRSLEGQVSAWLAATPGNDLASLAGVVDGSHPLMVNDYFKEPPRCPASPAPANPRMPTLAEGAYQFDANGTLADCPFGDRAVHGHY